MPPIALAVLVVVALAAFALFVPRSSAAEPPPAKSEPAMPRKPLSREELGAKLKTLGEKPVQLDPSPRAMCYEMAAPPDTADFVCPKDGSRTHYSKNVGLAERVRSVSGLDGSAQMLRGVSATVDLSEFCRKCTPRAPDDPQAILVVKLPDGTEKRTRGVSDFDLALLERFLAGELTYTVQGETKALKEHLPRIRELLGLPEADVGRKAK